MSDPYSFAPDVVVTARTAGSTRTPVRPAPSTVRNDQAVRGGPRDDRDPRSVLVGERAVVETMGRTAASICGASTVDATVTRKEPCRSGRQKAHRGKCFDGEFCFCDAGPADVQRAPPSSNNAATADSAGAGWLTSAISAPKLANKTRLPSTISTARRSAPWATFKRVSYRRRRNCMPYSLGDLVQYPTLAVRRRWKIVTSPSANQFPLER